MTKQAEKVSKIAKQAKNVSKIRKVGEKRSINLEKIVKMPTKLSNLFKKGQQNIVLRRTQ